MNFRGAARRIDDIDLPRIGAEIGVGEDELHAFLEVESRGAGFDAEGRPKILFEPHVFYRCLPKAKRAAAVRAKLAAPKWGQIAYGKESQQYDRLERAIAIDQTAALKACSWGLTQILGENHHMVGYDNVQAMVKDFMDDEENHVEAMVRYLVAAGIDDDLRAHRWEVVARVYNGPGYRKNSYHTKMAAAFRKWQRIKDTAWEDDDKPLAKFEIEALQKRLRALGYFEVGKVDGAWGSRTTAAVSAFQHQEGLEITGKYDAATRDCLKVAKPRPVSPERAATTVDDLRQAGARTIIAADVAEDAADNNAKTATATAGAAVSGGILKIASDHFETARSFLDPVREFFSSVPGEMWFLIVIGLAGAFLLNSLRTKQAVEVVRAVRLEDERTGKTAGMPDPAPSPPVEVAPEIDAEPEELGAT